jgi:hypothetical protein
MRRGRPAAPAANRVPGRRCLARPVLLQAVRRPRRDLELCARVRRGARLGELVDLGLVRRPRPHVWLQLHPLGHGLLLQPPQRHGHAHAADRRRIRDRCTLQPRVAALDLADEAEVVRPDDRHVPLAGGLEGIHHGVVDAGRPDAVHSLARVEEVEHLLPAGCELPPGEDLLDDPDVRVLLQGLLEALVAIGIGRHARDASHLHHVAAAPELLEQPLGADAAVRDLIVRRVVRARRIDELVDEDDLDSPRPRLLRDRLQGIRVRRVDDQRVDACRDQRADVGDLTCGVGLAVEDPEPRHPSALQGLRPDGADHPLSPAVADERVGDAKRELLLGARRLAGRGGRGHQQAEDGEQNAETPSAPATCAFTHLALPPL